MLSAEQILAANDTGIESVDVPEWGGSVCIRTMTGTERDSWELYYQSEVKKRDNANVRAKLCALTICDESGKRLFTDQQVADLAKKNAKALDRVFTAATRLNKITEDEIEELEKN